MARFVRGPVPELRTPEAVESYVQNNLRWNMSAGIIDAVFFALGAAIISNETVIPLLLTRLGASSVVLGLITALTNVAILLPQLFGAGITQERPYKKPITMLFGPGERLPFLLIGLAVWTWGAAAPSTALVAYVLLRVLSSVSVGTIIPAWYTLIGKTIPTRRRGLFFGLGRGSGALLGAGGAMLAGYLLDSQGFPRGFALCFVLASLSMFLSWSGLAITREPPDLAVKPRTPMRAYFAQLPVILRGNRNYAHFVAARCVIVLGTMAQSFFIVYGSGRYGLTGTQVGALTATIATSQAVLYLVWGLIADRYGHKRVLCIGAAAMVCAALVARMSPTVGGLFVAFALMGAAVSAEMISSSSIVLEFAPADEQPTYVGLSNTLVAPFRTLAPILGGALAAGLGFSGLFAVAALVSAAGVTSIVIGVREPRTHPMPPGSTVTGPNRGQGTQL
jgi:MFS family permease